MNPVLLVHGGAWNIPDDTVAAHERGVQNALHAGWRVLERGGSSLDAVEESVAVLEDDDTFDAGRGSFLTSDGTVEMDALIMCGSTLRAGGVGGVRRVRNAIKLSRVVLEKSPHVYFVGEGAERFGAAHGIPLIDNQELITERERERLRDYQAHVAAGGKDTTFSGPPEFAAYLQSHDTVGAVALDRSGHIAAATSTGGTLGKTPGRVGDSSLIGCGCYADNLSAAVSCTGWGEPIMKLVLAKWAADKVMAGADPASTAQAAIKYLETRLTGHGGMIMLDAKGRWGFAHNTPRMAWGVATGQGARVGTKI
jgi:L-asparaginase / beta-aspartyl-peptidase